VISDQYLVVLITNHRSLTTVFQKKGNKSNEGPGLGKEDLREVQGDYAQGCSAGHLRKRKA
jgi:hypothetical protein